MPTPYGAARTPPEPLPVGACPPPPQNLVPGPLTPDKAPPGPPDCLSLPPGAPGAFQCENYPPEFDIFASAGIQALQRQKLGKGAIATDSPSAQGGPFVTQRFNDITPDVGFGPAMGVGVLYDAEIIEASGYFIPRNSSSVTATMPNGITTLFFDVPSTFGGVNGASPTVSTLTTSLTSQIGNAELNYRYTGLAFPGCELILGVRYFDVEERLSTFADVNPPPMKGALSNPTGQATYTAGTHNRILAGQLGFEGNWEVFECRYFLLSLGTLAKGDWGGNFVSDSHRLIRGDGFLGFDVNRGDTIFSMMYELGAFVEVHVADRVRVRGGYNALWLTRMEAVVDQFNFDLGNPQGRINHQGSVLYAGPSLLLELLF